jgi:hypothetical protein
MTSGTKVAIEIKTDQSRLDFSSLILRGVSMYLKLKTAGIIDNKAPAIGARAKFGKRTDAKAINGKCQRYIE